MGKATQRILGEAEIRDFVETVARKSLEQCPDPALLAFVGIRSRGVHLAQRIRDRASALRGAAVPIGALDITLYRDDLDEVAAQPVVRKTDLPFDIRGRFLVLVDDVLFTGRTVRAALDQLIDFGRPKAIRLAVLVDRGNRELPVQADFVGKSVPTRPGQDVQVRLREEDGADEVLLADRSD
ncbi:MAG: bifunctional pyr operon transcriptional regulator/uracil phosphoribosyltransferase PyrR [Planctomycetes bacterium]|nr:bifunctional pyr operon transcriptional regulator/uracil phosphoribosyltransferase PyrR [Planctomycetota bacterium]